MTACVYMVGTLRPIKKWLPFLDYIFFYKKRYNLSHISQNFVPNGWNSGKSLEVQRR